MWPRNTKTTPLLQVSAWGDHGDPRVRSLYSIPLTSAGGGFFEPRAAEVFVTLPAPLGTGAIQYIPSGAGEGNLIYASWGAGRIDVLLIDQATGFPIDAGTGLAALGTSTPRIQPFAWGFGGGPAGLEFDPLTNDLFVSPLWGHPLDSIVRIGGFPHPEPLEPRFRRGDCNDDGEVNISDVVCTLNWLFLGEAEPGCAAATNADGAGALNITDPIYLLTHLFLGGPAPAAPFPDCGPGQSPADDELSCERPPRSCQQ